MEAGRGQGDKRDSAGGVGDMRGRPAPWRQEAWRRYLAIYSRARVTSLALYRERGCLYPEKEREGEEGKGRGRGGGGGGEEKQRSSAEKSTAD